MIKEFILGDTLIPIEDYYVVVDKEAERNGLCYDSYERFIRMGTGNNSNNTDWYKIIATIGKDMREQGIPLIEADEAEQYASKYHTTLSRKIATEAYKAAQSKGTYALDGLEEILRNYFKVKHVPHFGLDVVDLSEHIEAALKVQSLQKKKVIKAVVLEMEQTNQYIPQNPKGDVIPNGSWKEQVKITDTETNTITPVKVKYE